MSAAVGILLAGAGIGLTAVAVAGRGRRAAPLPEGIGFVPESLRGQGGDGPPLPPLLARAALGRDAVRRLARAGVATPAVSFALRLLVVAASAGLVAGAGSGSPAAALLVFASAVALARIGVRRRAARRVERFDAELPEALDLLAGSLEAGSSLAQAMEVVAAEGEPPLSSVFAEVLAESRLGEPIADALDAAAERTGSREFAWFVRAVRAQQELGASLAGLLRTLAQFVRWRQELRREVSALTAEGRLSAWVLGGLPFVVAGFFAIANPSYLGALFGSPAGWALLATAALFLAGGIVWLVRIVRTEG